MGTAKKTHAQYVSQIKEKHEGRLKVVGVYQGASTKIDHKCRTCKTIFSATPGNVGNKGSGCPVCSIKKQGSGEVSEEDFKQRLFSKHGDKISLTGKYTSITSQLKFSCLNGHTWTANGIDVARATGCPCCSSKTNKNYTLGKNIVNVQGSEHKVLDFFLSTKTYKAKDLKVGKRKVPVIPYRFSGKLHKYYPDIYSVSDNTLYEVKSKYTLGLNPGEVYTLKSSTVFNQNKKKARAAIAAGFNFEVLVVSRRDNIIALPKDWTKMKRREIKAWLEDQYNPQYATALIERLKGHAFV